MYGQRRRNRHAVTQRTARERDETDRHQVRGSKLCPPAGPAARVHEPHAGEHLLQQNDGLKLLITCGGVTKCLLQTD